MVMLTHTSGRSVDSSTLPVVSQEYLWAGGFNHAVGNVCQSKRTGEIKAKIAEASGIKASAVSREQVEAWRAAHKEESDAMLNRYMDEMVADLIAGTVGVRETKTRIDERTRRFNTKVLARIRKSLGDAGLTLMKDVDHVYSVPRPDGTFVSRTRADFIKAMTERQGANIYAEVDAELAAEAANADKSAVDDII